MVYIHTERDNRETDKQTYRQTESEERQTDSQTEIKKKKPNIIILY